MEKDKNITNKFEGLTDKFALSNQELTEMKNSILSEQVSALQPIVSPWSSLFSPKIYVPVFASLLFIFTGTASVYSQPGSMLYPLKTQVLEDVVGFTKISDFERAQYSNELLSRRLQEIQIVIEEGASLSEGEQENLNKHINEYVNNIEATSKNMSATERLEIFGITNQTLALHENVLEDSNFTSLIKVNNAVNTKMDSSLSSAVKDFTSSATNLEIRDYLGDQVDVVSELLEDESVSDEALTDVGAQLQEAGELVESGDFEEAVTQVLKSQDLILSETSTPDAEDIKN